MAPTDRQRWARVPPALAWKLPGLPTNWTRVLDRNPEAMNPGPLPGYVWLDTPGKVLHAPKRDLEFTESCVYCGAEAGTTNDDVPPRNLFLRPLPDNIVKVAACQPCNAGFSKDDEYMRLALYMRDDVMAHPVAQALRPDAWRAFTRPEAQAFTEAFCKLTEVHDVRLPSGDPAHLMLHTVGERVVNWVARITKGLYSHEVGEPLPADYRVEVGIEANFPRAVLEAPKLMERLNAQPLVDMEDGVFQYRCLLHKGHPGVSIWSMRFYQAVPFLVLTLPEQVPA